LKPTSDLRWAAGISAMGDGTFRSAVSLLAVSVSTSPQAVAVVAAGSSAAWFTGLWAGALTDRLPRRSVLLWANRGRAAALTILVGLIVLDKESLVVLVAAAFVVTVGTVFFDAATQAILPEFVGKDIEGYSGA
jgi:MFS family permease